MFQFVGLVSDDGLEQYRFRAGEQKL